MITKERLTVVVDGIRARAAERLQAGTVAENEAALKMGTALMDAMFRFRGEKKDPRQSLSWPRTGVFGKDGKPMAGVPEKVVEAAAFLSCCHLVGAVPLGSDREQDLAIVTHLLLLLDGLVDPDEPMQTPTVTH